MRGVGLQRPASTLRDLGPPYVNNPGSLFNALQATGPDVFADLEFGRWAFGRFDNAALPSQCEWRASRLATTHQQLARPWPTLHE